jgi:hypothetical protein
MLSRTRADKKRRYKTYDRVCIGILKDHNLEQPRERQLNQDWSPDAAFHNDRARNVPQALSA